MEQKYIKKMLLKPNAFNYKLASIKPLSFIRNRVLVQVRDYFTVPS